MPCGSSKVNSGSGDSSNKNEENGCCAFEDLDHSVLQHPLYTGVRNVKQILKCLQDATKEVKDVILNECNIIYECKVCANLFRSLANLLYHKRCYCKKHLCEEMVLFDHFEEEQAVIIQPETPNEPETTPKLLKCTVDLVKTDLGNDKSVFVVEDVSKIGSEVKQSSIMSKGNKSKESVDKKTTEVKKSEHSMISRRTRDKNSQKAVKKKKLDNSQSVESQPKAKKIDNLEIINIDSGAQNEIDLEVKMETTNNNANDFQEKEMTQENMDIKEENESQKLDNEISKPNESKLDILKENDLLEENSTEAKADDASKISLKLTKKIIFAKPKSLQIKNSVVLDDLRKNLETENIGLTKITNASGKKVCFPKLILKTVDGNPHAVFQKAEAKQSSTPTIKSPTDQKPENEKLILVLKKDALSPAKPIQEKTESANNKNVIKSTEFHHLTRRKRLLARNDCKVQELKCLTCNTIFTSLKTLYFHMLSIHSKKRLYYPCPLCKAYFVQIYGVTRHLVSIHNKTKDQINKLRDTIKKKSIWKKVDDTISSKDGISIDETGVKKELEPETKHELVTSEIDGSTPPAIKTIIKLNKNVNFHQCSKCSRVFGRKSSQVSHEKFCIMNAIKVETVDLAAQSPPTSPPLISFLSLAQKRQSIESETNKQIQSLRLQTDPDIKISIRPKRKAEKLMHKDFIDSQTLKWRSVNKVVNNTKTSPAAKKSTTKNLEKKVSNIMNVENLTCLKCGKNFSSYSNLKRHVAIHVGWTRFRCVICEYQAYNKSQCWFHVQKFHDISENEVEKYVQNLGSNWLSKKPVFNQQSQTSKINSPGNLKKQSVVQKIKKKKNIGRPSEKKFTQSVKKLSLDGKKDSDSRKEKSLSVDNKKEAGENKKKIQYIETKKDTNEMKKEKSHCLDSKKEANDSKKEKSQSISFIQKSNVSDFKKDLNNYKSVTTNNPTTIILSKKLPSSSAQSVVTIPTESQSSNKTCPLRSSPRKIEIKSIKSPEEKSLTSLVTRSTAYAKSSIQIKITPPRPTSAETIKKSLNQYPEKTSPKKDKLISEWFPKKDLNSNTSRRESAPLIIGLVPASSSGLSVRTKNPAITYEKSGN